MDKRPFAYIGISASLFGISPPLAKLLLKDIAPVALAGFLYLGAFLGLSLYSVITGMASARGAKRAGLRLGDLPWLSGAILSGGIIAPICLMLGLRHVSGFTTSLLLNLEGVFTAIIAVFLFRENAGKRLWLALTCMTAAGVFLTWDASSGKFTLLGPLLVALSMLCWGIDNNLTRHISTRNPIQIARVKGLVAGMVSLSLAHETGIDIRLNTPIGYALLLGALSYGISLVFFIKALERLGSFRTGMFFSLAPFVGAVLSLVLLQEWIGWVMLPAVILTLAGVVLMTTEKHEHLHSHEEKTHTHLHQHDDLHHDHEHLGDLRKPHIHEHEHRKEWHAHSHWPDAHHRHEH